MNVGIFIPIGNNGWLISENAPPYKPTFALNKETTSRNRRPSIAACWIS
jgi:pyrimidine oxygenase